MNEQSDELCAAYLTLRHREPEVVRLLRLCLDMGLRLDDLLAEESPVVKNALAYMKSDPGAGRVRWDGQQYSFVDVA